jgi:hypothetical protein
MRNGLEEFYDFLIDGFEFLEVELTDEILFQIDNNQLAELGEQLVFQWSKDVHHVFLVLIKPLSCLRVAE